MMKHFAGEITIHYQYNSPPNKLPQFKSPKQAVDYAREHLFADCMEHHEELYALYFNRKLRTIGYTKVGQGTVSASVCNIPLVMQAAILSNSSNIILMHNHPSGEVEPSHEDLLLTEHIAKAAKLFDIVLQDHIIISNYDFESLRQRHPRLFDTE